jgi:hypothetical protein
VRAARLHYSGGFRRRRRRFSDKAGALDFEDLIF